MRGNLVTEADVPRVICLLEGRAQELEGSLDAVATSGKPHHTVAAVPERTPESPRANLFLGHTSDVLAHWSLRPGSADVAGEHLWEDSPGREWEFAIRACRCRSANSARSMSGVMPRTWNRASQSSVTSWSAAWTAFWMPWS